MCVCARDGTHPILKPTCDIRNYKKSYTKSNLTQQRKYKYYQRPKLHPVYRTKYSFFAKGNKQTAKSTSPENGKNEQTDDVPENK